jgi:hypothetical protein
MLFAGLDPGKEGALVVLDAGGPAPLLLASWATDRAFLVDGVDYADGAMRDALAEVKRLDAYLLIERQQAFDHDGPRQAFATGHGFGLWRGLARALGVRFGLVHPRTWQGVMLPATRVGRGLDTKKASVATAQERLPELELVGKGCRRAHDGLADAACIALYGARTYGAGATGTRGAA